MQQNDIIKFKENYYKIMSINAEIENVFFVKVLNIHFINMARRVKTKKEEELYLVLQDFVNIIRIGMANNRNLIDELPKYADTITGGEGVELDFNSMDRQRLGLIDIDSLTYLQKQLMAIRLGEL